MTPGFIEGHGHFMGLGYNELNVDLLQTKSYDEVIQKVKAAVDAAKPGEWITGRGWHQSKWNELVQSFAPGTFAPCDVPILREHLQTQADLARVHQKILDLELLGDEVITLKNGNKALSPFYNERERLRNRLVKLSTQLKATPNSRKQSVQTQRNDMGEDSESGLRAVV